MLLKRMDTFNGIYLRPRMLNADDGNRSVIISLRFSIERHIMLVNCEDGFGGSANIDFKRNLRTSNSR